MTDDAFLARLEGPSPAADVARDIVRRGVWIAPVLMGIGAAVWSTDGFFSVGYGVLLVLANFALAALIIATTSRISLSLMMAGVLFGFLIRLGIIFVAVYAVKDAGWMNILALGLTIIVTHLGLLIWELRFVSASLAYPGLKPGVAAATLTTDLTRNGGSATRHVPTGTDKEHAQP